MNRSLYRMGQKLAKYGRGQDSVVAHITPKEAELLKRMGGAGTRNPITGLLEYRGGGMGGGNDPADPGSGGMGGSDAESDPGAAAAAAAAQADAQAAENAAQGFGGTAAAAAEARDALNRARLAQTAMVQRPTMAQIPEMSRLSAINTVENPVAAAAVRGMATAAMPGIMGPAVGMMSMMDPSPSPFGMDSPLGLSPDVGPAPPADTAFGGQEPGGGRRGPGRSSASLSQGGSAEEPGATAAFYYTNPFTGQVEPYLGGMLPWLS